MAKKILAKKILKWALLTVTAVLIFGQLIRPARTNPPIDQSRTFGTLLSPPPDVARMIKVACGDCHSHNTVWPWYSKVAPVMWLVASDVDEGRSELDFSDWAHFSPDRSRRKLRAICREVKEGDMPPWYYSIMHPASRLSSAQRQALCAFTTAAATRQ